jgi:single-strand DNA-binding protein
MSARITIDGNLVADPDFGVSTAGTSWAHLRVASHERVKRNGEWTSTDPEFFNVTVFGKAAEDAGDTLHKGDRVTVEGRPELELFDRRDGSTGAAIKVYARTVTLTNDDTTADRNGQDVDQDTTPTIHHTSEATMVVGVAPIRDRAASDPQGPRLPMVVRDHQLEPAQGHGRAHPRRPRQRRAVHRPGERPGRPRGQPARTRR